MKIPRELLGGECQRIFEVRVANQRGFNSNHCFSIIISIIFYKKKKFFFVSADMSTDLFVQTKNEAQDYLSYQRRKRGGGTNIYEECCGERCRIEEIKEYC